MANEVIQYGDVYSRIRSILTTHLNVPVHVARIPNPRPDQFIVITPSGGDEKSVTHASRSMILDVWAARESEAYALAEKAGAYLRATKNNVSDEVLIYSVSPLGGIVWMPDPDADVPRFRQNWQVVCRGTVVDTLN